MGILSLRTVCPHSVMLDALHFRPDARILKNPVLASNLLSYSRLKLMLTSVNMVQDIALSLTRWCRTSEGIRLEYVPWPHRIQCIKYGGEPRIQYIAFKFAI